MKKNSRCIRTRVAVLLLLFLASAATTLASDPQNCLFCHKYRRLRAFTAENELRNFYVDINLYNESIHRDVSCVDCHSDIEEIPHQKSEKVDCAKMCHLDRWEALTGTKFSHRETADEFMQSIHGVKPDDPPEIAAIKPDCKYCHMNDLYSPGQEVPSEKVLKRCANCHKEDSLNDIFIHISHRFKTKTSRPGLEVVELCASCHADKDFHNIVGFTGPQADAVDTYKETIHYRILQFGGTDTAHCLSCHATESIHDIRPASDPASAINEKNRSTTCAAGECHEGAGTNISKIDSHLSKASDRGPEIHIVELCMEGVMFATLFILFLLMGMETYGRLRNRDARFFRWLRKPAPLSNIAAPTQRGTGTIPNLHRHVDSNPKGDYRRYSVHIVINHFVMMLAFTVSVASGLPLFFHNAEWAHTAVRLMGGIDMTRLIHRISAVVFTLDCLYHLVVILFGTASKLVRGTFDIKRTQVPLWKDIKDLYFDFRYFLGLEKSRPKMEKFMYKQKLHYLAMVWGCSVLTLSGCCLLFPETMVEYIPFSKVSFNILRLMHAEESVLAFLVITLWHLYNVHIAPGRFPIQWTFWNGLINKDHQIEEHYLEYERQVKEGLAESEEERLLRGDVHDDC